MQAVVLKEGSSGKKATHNAFAEKSDSVKHRLWHLASNWAFFDVVIAVISMFVAYRFSPAASYGAYSSVHAGKALAATVVGGVAFLLSYLLGMNHHPNLNTRTRIVVLVAAFSSFVLIGTTLILNIIFYKQIGRYIVIICGVVFFFAQILARLAWFSRVRSARHRVGVHQNDHAYEELTMLQDESPFPLQIMRLPDLTGCGVSEAIERLESMQLHEIIIKDGGLLPDALLLRLLNQGFTVSTIDAFIERHFSKVPVSFLKPDWFYQIDLKLYHPFYGTIKRFLDIFMAAIIGIATFPFIVIAFLLIKFESRGPAFYSQVRVGLRQKKFRIWKLRTMREDSERNGPRWAQLRDPRVTRVGHFLRKTRIDEIPQLWNILRGEMSFVGPRPERPEFVAILSKEIPCYEQRHLMMPGLTGWAQINYPYGANVKDAREKLCYDLFYMKNASFLLDLHIVLRTIGTITRGAR